MVYFSQALAHTRTHAHARAISNSGPLVSRHCAYCLCVSQDQRHFETVITLGRQLQRGRGRHVAGWVVGWATAAHRARETREESRDICVNDTKPKAVLIDQGSPVLCGREDAWRPDGGVVVERVVGEWLCSVVRHKLPPRAIRVYGRKLLPRRAVLFGINPLVVQRRLDRCRAAIQAHPLFEGAIARDVVARPLLGASMNVIPKKNGVETNVAKAMLGF
jgi:hypothetical protein